MLKIPSIAALWIAVLVGLSAPASAQVPDVGPGRCYANCSEDVEESPILQQPDPDPIEPEPVYREPRRRKQLKPPAPRRPSKREAAALFARGESYYYQGDYAESLSLIKRAYKKFPAEPRYLQSILEIYFKMANHALNGSDYEGALKIIRAGLHYDPDNSDLLLLKGIVYGNIANQKWNAEDYRGAWRMMQRAAELAPNHTIVQWNFQIMKEEVLLLDDALRLHRQGYRAHRRGNNERALEFYLEAYKLLPNEPKITRGLAQAKTRLGRDYIEAGMGKFLRGMDLLTEAIKMRPDDPATRQNYAYGNYLYSKIYMRHKDYWRVFRLLEEAAKYDPRYAADLEKAREAEHREKEAKVAAREDWQRQLRKEAAIEPVPPLEMPLSSKGISQTLSRMEVEDLDPEKLREIETWIKLRRTNVKAMRLGKPVGNVVMYAGTHPTDRIEWNIPKVMDLLAEQGLLGEYYDRNIGGITEQREIEAFHKAMRQSIDRVVARGTVPGSTQVHHRIHGQIRERALSTVRMVDDWVLSNKDSITATNDHLLPLVKFVLAPETVSARAAMFVGSVAMNVLKKRSENVEISAQVWAEAVGEEIISELGGKFIKNMALKSGFVATETDASTFSYLTTQYYAEEKRKR